MSIFNKFSRGHIGKWWEANDYKNLNYIKQPVTIEEENDWKNKGYDYVKSFTGWMYDSRNPMPNFVNSFESIFPLKELSYTFYKMKTLEIMPEHVDHFRTYIKLTGANYKQIKRVLIMLENWKPGHYLEIAGKGITDWIAGDYFIWDSDVPHAASNIGVEDRYTLQITGIYFTDEQVYQKLHWYNIGDLPNKKESDFSIQMFHIKKHLQNNHGKPYMVYMYNQNIKELENLIHKNEVIEYFTNSNNYYYLKYAIIAVIIGTIAGDYLMFYTIEKSSKANLPIAIALIHLAPIFSLFLVYLWFKKRLNYKSIIGIIMVFIGTLIAIYFSHS